MIPFPSSSINVLRIYLRTVKEKAHEKKPMIYVEPRIIATSNAQTTA
ncbi:hypothetical protein GRAN_5215 [Granulicella sibirica]|uniref:Uncharacterized protein n=1 Tax=Granulicella sibirica TaxID=2479048 RepID=A0A4Q0ST93_9BACT|nr:hypothetical protein GRAN_5215 [Granulicella sibirica]